MLCVAWSIRDSGFGFGCLRDAGRLFEASVDFLEVNFDGGFGDGGVHGGYSLCDATTNALPAHEVESLVTEQLRAFLESDAKVFDGLSATAESPAIVQPLVTAAKKLAASFASLPSDDLRDLLASFLQSVIIQENNIQVMIRRTDLRELLENGDQIIVAKRVGIRERRLHVRGYRLNRLLLFFRQ